jgi:hypothetical protein
MADTELSDIDIRLECLRIAVEFGTQRDMQSPENLVERYYQVVTQGSGANRPDGGGEDHSRKKAKKSRNVREGSVPQNQTTMLTD